MSNSDLEGQLAGCLVGLIIGAIFSLIFFIFKIAFSLLLLPFTLLFKGFTSLKGFLLLILTLGILGGSAYFLFTTDTIDWENLDFSGLQNINIEELVDTVSTSALDFMRQFNGHVTYAITGNRVNGRECPSTSCEVKTIYDTGEEVDVRGLSLGESVRNNPYWVIISDPDHGDVYVHLSVVRALGPEVTNPDIVATRNTTVRSGPSNGYGEYGYIYAQEDITVLSRNLSSDWVYIQTETLTGWICRDHLTDIESHLFLSVTDNTSYSCFDSHLSVRGFDDGSYTGVGIGIAEVVYINGIQTNYDDHIASIRDIMNAFDTFYVAGIYNKTDSFTADLSQALNDIEDGFYDDWRFRENAVTQTLYNLLRSRDEPLKIVSHSQGTAIVSAALRMIEETNPDKLRLFTVYTFARVGIRYPSGSTYWHCIRIHDSIAHSNLEEFMEYNENLLNTTITFAPNLTVVADSPITGWTNHDFGSYLDSYRTGECRG